MMKKSVKYEKRDWVKSGIEWDIGVGVDGYIWSI
jgi:hypothetical protein